MPREYPKGLGRALARLNHKLFSSPEPCLRQKSPIFGPSELEVFRMLPLGDLWPDAGAVQCFEYLWHSKHLAIPSEWKQCMMEFAHELRAAFWLKMGSFQCSGWR